MASSGIYSSNEKPRFKSQSEHRRSYGATDGADREADPADGALSPHRIEPATVLVDIKAWPGNVSGFGKVGAPASLDIHCARRRLSRAGRDGETGSAAEQRN
jgi:hypothetical protein